jgi:hypothetical protein
VKKPTRPLVTALSGPWTFETAAERAKRSRSYVDHLARTLTPEQLLALKRLRLKKREAKKAPHRPRTPEGELSVMLTMFRDHDDAGIARGQNIAILAHVFDRSPKTIRNRLTKLLPKRSRET